MKITMHVPVDIQGAEQALVQFAAECQNKTRKAPIYWLLVLGGGVMALAMLLEVFIAFEWWALPLRDGRGQLGPLQFGIAMVLAVLTAMVIGLVIHPAYKYMPSRMKMSALVILTILAIVVVMAAPLSVVLTQPGIAGNSLLVSEQPVDMEQLQEWALISRTMLFLLAAFVAAKGIETLRHGTRGLASVRVAKQQLKESQKLLRDLTRAEKECATWARRRQARKALLRERFIEACCKTLEYQRDECESYLHGNMLPPLNQPKLGRAFRQLMLEKEAMPPSLRTLVDKVLPPPLRVEALPPAEMLSKEARALIREHMRRLQMLGSYIRERIEREDAK